MTDLSLTGAAARQTFPPAQLRLLQQKLWALLRRQALDYTKGESTSLPQETMTELLASLCYTMHIDPAGDPRALRPLLDADPDALYRREYAALLRKAGKARQTIAQLCAGTPDIGCIALRDTLRSLRAGLDAYDARFFAHRVPGSIDYQLLRAVPETLLGVDYALTYMQRLGTELRFLGRFALHRRLALLDGVNPGWRELVCNLYTPIAANALGLTLLGDDARRLHIGDAQRERLLDRLAHRPAAGLETELFAAASSLCTALGLTGEDDRALLLALAIDLAPRVHCACAAGDLSQVFCAFGVPGRRR